MGVVYPDLPRIRWPQMLGRDSYLIGLTGGIGSGKSTARAAFAEAGAVVADADRIAHEVLHSDELRPQLEAALGPGIFDESGTVSRPAIAKLVFADPDLLAKLNALVHPAVRGRLAALRDGLPPGGVLAYDVPLLFETGQGNDYDLTVVISAPADLRFQRVAERSGWDRAEFDRREAAQMPLREKEELADFVIENIASNIALHEAVDVLMKRIREARPTSN